MGDLVRLQFALLWWVMEQLGDEQVLTQIIRKNDLKVESAPFMPILPPDMLRPEVFARTARLEPAEDKFHLEKDGLYLAGSAEQTLLPLYMDTVIDESRLP